MTNLSPVKWVGGKRKLAPIILDHVRPPTRLVEPFGGSLSFTAAFAERFPNAPIFVSDALEPMIDLWTRLANPDVRAMIRDLSKVYCARNKASRKIWYYELRERYTAGFDDPNIAAAVLFAMLRTCYSGMFRMGAKSGIFNTPAGFMVSKSMYNESCLDAFVKLIQQWTLTCRDYRDSLSDVIDGSFVYLDPPYKDTYDGYCGKTGFDQRGLAPFIRECVRRGAQQVIMSQSYTPEFWHESLPEARQVVLERREGINRNVAEVGRPLVKELLLIVERA